MGSRTQAMEAPQVTARAWHCVAALLTAGLAAGLLGPWGSASGVICAAACLLAAVALLAASAIGANPGALARAVVWLSAAQLVAAAGIVRSALAGGFQASALTAVAAMAAMAIAALASAVAGSRMAEVSARFALDSMPGRQIGIDTAVQAGAISPAKAAEAVAAVEREAQRLGALDGAARFARLTVAGIIAAAAAAAALGSAIWQGSWQAPLAASAWAAAILLAASALAGLSIALAAASVGAAPSQRRWRGIWASWAAAGVAMLAAGFSGGCAGLPLAATGAALLAASWAARRLVQRARQPGLPVTISLPAEAAGALPADWQEAAAVLLAARLGVPVNVRIAPGPGWAVSVASLPAALPELPVGQWLALGEGDEAAPDGRPARWSNRPEGEALAWHQVLLWHVLRQVMTAAPFAVPVVVSLFEELAGAEAQTVAGAAQTLWRWGLPLPDLEYVAAAAAQAGDGEELARRLRVVALRKLLSACAEPVAQQLHPYQGQLLAAALDGQPVGEELEGLRRAIVEASWQRPSWQWPIVLVAESGLVDSAQRITAGLRAEVVVAGADELAEARPDLPIGVLEVGARSSEAF